MSFEDKIRKVVPYTPGEQTKDTSIIKINTNECPYPPAPGVEKALRELDIDRLRLYPEPACDTLINALAEYYGLEKNQIFVGVGSDDVLSMAFLTFFNSDKKILFPDITYSFYDVWADVYRIPYEQIPLDDNFHIVKEDYYKDNGGVIFPNPNAPTGVYEGLDMIEDVIKHNQDSVVIIDEAYIDFGGKSALELINKYDNLLVIQTYSKSRALAGLRVGMAFGNAKLIKYMSDVKFSVNSYTMNTPSLVAGAAAIKDEAYFKETVQKIINTREWMKKELKELGFEFQDSMSNFVFATHPKYKATELQQYLRDNKILVRHFNAKRIDNYLRISVGTDDQAKKLIETLRNYIK
ncbi:MAG: histidinol-phosphate transaminase [Lachnospiraceae bacterium]|nr:histidinol-phosphate transaminase [Lachnospiraceae bacterium]